MSKARNTTASVSTHLCLTSIRIIEAPLEIGFLRPLDEDETICTDRNPSPAGFSDEVFQTILFQEGLSMIDEDEVIATPAHLHKRNLHRTSDSEQVQISNDKSQMNAKCLNVKISLT
jgi:hypothetical protein